MLKFFNLKSSKKNRKEISLVLSGGGARGLGHIGVIEVLEEKGIKQVWLAEKLGKSFNTVNAYVQNRTQPSLEVLYEIAEILNVKASDLLIENQ